MALEAHLRQASRSKGWQKVAQAAELSDAEIPFVLLYLWEAFLQLNQTRQYGLGPLPILYNEILAYSALMGVDFEPWEINTLKQLDMVMLATTAKTKETSN